MLNDDELQELKLHFYTHDAQCEERWKTIYNRMEGVEARLDKMHQLILAGGATTIMFLLGILSAILIQH